MCTLTNSDDPDEMPQNVAFHHGLLCLILKAKRNFRERNTIIINCECDPSVYTMDLPKFSV